MEKVGNASIYNENCLTAFKKLPDNSIDFIATDPPYFLDGMGDDWSDKELNKKKDKAKVIGSLPVGMKFDPAQGKRLQEFFSIVSKEAMRVLKPGGFMVAFSQARLFHRMAVASEDAGFEVRDMLIWEHNGGQGKAFTQDHFIKKMKLSEKEKSEMIAKLENRKTPQIRPKFEAILMAQKPKDGTFVDNWLKWKTGLIKIDFDLEPQQSTVFHYKKPEREEFVDHMTVKPIDLMERLIDVFSLKGQTVLDPFLGSGTTGIASLKMGRKFIGFEIEEKYVNMSIKRLKNI
jgi:site-specific DNA-methyltransferase (adenine-specific)